MARVCGKWRRQRQAYRIAGLPGGTVLGVRELDHGAAVTRVLVVEQPLPGGLADRGGRSRFLVDRDLPFPGGPGRDQRAVALAGPLPQPGIGQHALGVAHAIVNPLLREERLGEPLEVLVLEQAQFQPPAVRALVVAELGWPAGNGTEAASCPRGRCLHRVGADQLERGLVQGHVNVLAEAPALPGHQGGRDAVQRDRSAVAGRLRYGTVDGFLAPVADVVHRRAAGVQVEARSGTDDPLPRRDIRPGVVRREAGQRQVEQPLVPRKQRPCVQSPCRHLAWPETLNEHIRPVDQAAGHGPVVGLAEIEDDALLPPLQQRVRGMRPARAARRVHPDDLRAQVAKHHRGKRAGDVVAEIHHKQPAKCSRHGRLLREESSRI